MDTLLRLLDLLRRELGAADVRAEIGGREPEDPRLLSHRLPSGHRLVAVFDEIPSDPEGKLEKLIAIASSFASMGEPIIPSKPERASATFRTLREELDALSARAGSLRALIIDDKSPVVWGSSDSSAIEDDVETACLVADVWDAAVKAGCDPSEALLDPSNEHLNRVARAYGPGDKRASVHDARAAAQSVPEPLRSAHVHTLRGIAAVRRAEGARDDSSSRLLVRDGELIVLARPFATIYRLVLVFDATFSELHADAALLRALPIVERLVLSLPPRDPVPAGGRVLKMARRLRSV